jgi:RHS repeat-associated protein
VTAWPTASGITSGQTLASSTLLGGTASVAGAFAWTTPTTVPNVGTTSQSVTFTPALPSDYNSVVGSAPVTVSVPQCNASYHRTITIDHKKVPNTDQVNFPFLFSTTDQTLATLANGGHVASPNGYDITFSTDPNGLTALDYELEEYDPTTGQIVAWVRIPTLSHSLDTVLYMFYGNSSISTSQQNPAGVWDSNYLGVWHLPNDATLSANDSTSNGHNGTPGSSSIATVGEIGGGANVNASTTGAISIPPYSSVTFYEATFSAWVKMSQENSWAGIIFSRDSSDPIGMDMNGLGHLAYTWNDGSASTYGWDSGLTIPTGSWAYTVIAITPYGVVAYVCEAGSCNSSSQSLIENPQVSNTNWYLGSDQYSPSTRFWGGSLDEARISSLDRSSDWIAAEYYNQNSPATFYQLGSENAEVVIPARVNLYASQSQQFTASGECGPGISWSMPDGTPGILTSGGVYTAPASISTQETVAISASKLGSGESTGTSFVTLLPAPLTPILTLAPTVQLPYVVGATQKFTATLMNQSGTPIGGETITFAVIGDNSNSGRSTTDANGIATYTYKGVNSGNDTIQASANPWGKQIVSNVFSATWIVPEQPISTTSVVGRFFFNDDIDGNSVFNTSPTTSPVFTQEFPTISFNPPSGAIPGNTSVNVFTRPFTDVTVDENGNYSGTIVAQGNGYQAGNLGDNDIMGGFQAVFTGSYVVASAGDAVISVYVDNTFVLGIGGGATMVTGPLNEGQAVTTPFEQLPVMGASPIDNSTNGFSMTVNFPGPGTYPYELDYVECCGYNARDGLSLMTWAAMPNGTTSGIPPAASLTLTPNSIQPLPIGGQQAFTIFASDATGAAVPNLGLILSVTGVDNLQLIGTTDATGHATIFYQDVNSGSASVQAVAFISGMVIYSNIVNVPWTLPGSATGGSGTLSIGISADSTVIFPNTLQLTGTASDSSLPAGSNPTATWSQVSGPGTVTFSNTQQTINNGVITVVTTAAFSQAGNYGFKLSASDPNNSDSLQWPVTVAPAQTNQGWIGSPLFDSTVSGLVPISLASGVSIQQNTATLTYAPANNPSQTTPITITAGSGQIGTLDTTTLANGSYWIQLQATNTEGSFEYSLVLVSVAGNYKPGRLTATVTDLVVPATGLPINIQRTYDSLNASTSGDFGYGWNLGINVNLTVDPKNNVTFTLGGQRKTFYFTPSAVSWIFPFIFVSFTPEPGLHGTLTDSAPGCADALDIIAPDGFCVDGGAFNPPGYIYTDPNGTAYTISASGNLQSINDRSGNGLSITASGITSTTGLSVPFARDASNRITKITDPNGNIYQYGYDAIGNLVSVTYPPTAQAPTCPGASATNTSQYAYYEQDSFPYNHYYQSGTDGRCNPLPVTAYYDKTNDNGNSALDGRLFSVTDSFNNTTSYAYTLSTTSTINGVSVPNTGVTTITYPDTGTATMIYDSYGDLLSSQDPLGNTTINAYDANRNLISTTDPLGHTTTSTYDNNGNKTSSTYPATPTSVNTTSTTAYNQYSEPTQTTDELGNIRTFNYDTNYNPQSVTDSLGTLASFVFNSNQTLSAGAIGFDITVNPAQASIFTYDADGNMTARTDALGRTTSYIYNSLGQKTSMTAPTPTASTGGPASTTTYAYDALGNLTQTAAPLSRTTKSTYDANGNKLTDTDARGNLTTYIYDSLNRLIETDYPTQPVTKATKTYDFRNNVIDEFDQANNQTHHEYDSAGRQIKVIRGYGTTNASATNYVYDNPGRKTSQTDANNSTTTYAYDADNRLVSVTSGYGTANASTTTYAYDDAGNRTAVTDARNNKTQFQFDARKRLTKTTYPDSTTTVNTYDGPGNLASVTDQALNAVQYTYDAANQLKSVVQLNHPNPLANTNYYGYDPLGNLTSLTDENLHTTSNTFDQLNEPIQKLLPDGQLTESRTYDAAGNLQTLTHFNGQITTYSYDALNRLLTRITPNEAPVSFTYTATGKYLTSTAGDGTVNYLYDSLDRLTSKATPEGTLSYTYYADGQVESIISSNPNGASVAYTYDDLNRLSTVVDNNLPGQNTTTYTYDPASNVATVATPNGITAKFTYDPLNRLTELSTPPVADYKYTLGPTGNRTGSTEQGGRALTWSYDNIYRLTSETIADDPTNNNGSASYTLDPVGNRTSVNSTFSVVNPVAGSYNPDDQLASEIYDANGNVTSTGGMSYTYDSQNHMLTASGNGKSISMIYDAFGNRVAKTVTANGVTGTTQYLVEDDVNPTGYPQVIEELSGPIGAGAVTRTYTYGLQRISQLLSPPLTGNNTWTPSFYVYDGGGSVRQLTDSTGTPTDEYEYDAYGNSFTKQGTTPNNYLYRGEQYDNDLGLYYLRARYYNPNTGRFLSRDPLDGNAIDPKSLHKYLYAGGDPANFIDPTGKGGDSVEVALLTTLQATALKAVFWGGGLVACGIAGADLWDSGEKANKGDKTTLAHALVLTFESLACGIFLATWPLLAF